HEIARGPQPALADHAVGGLDDGADHAADLAALGVDGTERKREVRLFGIAAAVDVQQEIARAGRLAAVHHLRQHRLDYVADFRPDLQSRPAERPGGLW